MKSKWKKPKNLKTICIKLSDANLAQFKDTVCSQSTKKRNKTSPGSKDQVLAEFEDRVLNMTCDAQPVNSRRRPKPRDKLYVSFRFDYPRLLPSRSKHDLAARAKISLSRRMFWLVNLVCLVAFNFFSCGARICHISSVCVVMFHIVWRHIRLGGFCDIRYWIEVRVYLFCRNENFQAWCFGRKDKRYLVLDIVKQPHL